MTDTNPPLFKRRAVGFFSVLLFVPQTWGSAFGAGFIYTAGQQYTKRPFLREGRMGVPFVTRKAPQTWGSAFGAGFTYTARQRYTNRPF